MKRKSFYIFLGDIIIVFLSFLAVQAYKQKQFPPVIETYSSSFVLFVIFWIIVSFSLRKYTTVKDQSNLFKSLTKIAITGAIVLGIISTLMYLLRIAYYSRFVVFGTLLVATLFETLLCVVFYWFRTATKGEPIENLQYRRVTSTRILLTRLLQDKKDSRNLLSDNALQKRQHSILSEISQEAYDFIFKYVPVDSQKTFILSTNSHLNIELLSFSIIDAIVNLKRINDLRYINKFFEAVNEKLPVGGVLVDYLETKNQRKKRILAKFPPILNYIFYSIDFFIKRILPKFKLTKSIYFLLTRGQNRVITKAEAFGRLYSCGFEVIDEMEADGYLFFIAIKAKNPLYPERPTYGPFIQLERFGKNGKIIKVYKLRTMHPYSEFLQSYMYHKSGLQEGGKFKDDFRVSNIGKFFRMFWLDELPMLLNLIKGELKLVGVRPLSHHYFGLYPMEMQQRRLLYKPGLIPPFYVHNPKTLDEVIESERTYLDEYDKHPVYTDFKYFFKAVYNILFKKFRSA